MEGGLESEPASESERACARKREGGRKREKVCFACVGVSSLSPSLSPSPFLSVSLSLSLSAESAARQLVKELASACGDMEGCCASLMQEGDLVTDALLLSRQQVREQ